jgi:hypothetical protein
MHLLGVFMSSHSLFAIGASGASQFPLACRNAIAPTIARMIAEKETLDLVTVLARNQARETTEREY